MDLIVLLFSLIAIGAAVSTVAEAWRATRMRLPQAIPGWAGASDDRLPDPDWIALIRRTAQTPGRSPRPRPTSATPGVEAPARPGLHQEPPTC